jgi:hypothetical protein
MPFVGWLTDGVGNNLMTISCWRKHARHILVVVWNNATEYIDLLLVLCIAVRSELKKLSVYM